MALSTYDTATDVIASLGTTPEERGLTTEEFKAKFDEAVTALVAWINATHIVELDALTGAASETTSGIVELATAAETTTGTDDTRAVHPAGLKVELDKKVSISGDTMTGTLQVTGELQIQNAGTDSFATLKGPINRSLRIDIPGNDNADGLLVRTSTDGGTNYTERLKVGADGSLTMAGNNVYHAGNSGPFYKGAGSPEGVVTAVVGAIYQRTDGGASTTLYVKQSGTGNTGWVAK